MAEKIGLYPRDISIDNHADYLHAAFGDHVNDKVIEAMVAVANTESVEKTAAVFDYWIPGAGNKFYIEDTEPLMQEVIARPKNVFPMLDNMAFLSPTVEERFVQAKHDPKASEFQRTAAHYLTSGQVEGWLDLSAMFASYLPQGDFQDSDVWRQHYGIQWSHTPTTGDALDVYYIISDALEPFAKQESAPTKQSFSNILNAINEIYDDHPGFHPLLHYSSPELGETWTQAADRGIYHPSAVPAEHGPMA